VILLDTSVLSLAFRRNRRGDAAEAPAVGLLRQLVEDDEEVVVPGIVLQELLSGVRSEVDFARLERCLSGFPVLAASEAQHRAAARIANTCRAGGVAAATVDCLIAAQAIDCGAALFALDGDFAHIARQVRLTLLPAPPAGPAAPAID
jgi:predicted nucleic acid-binding protein